MARHTGAVIKPRHKKDIVEQDTSRVYGGGNGGSNKGKHYSTMDDAFKKTKGYDKTTSTKQERRGNKSDSAKKRRGNTKRDKS